jgi:hypothetical protein
MVMMEKVEAKVDLRNVQEQVEDKAKKVQGQMQDTAKMAKTYGRKAERIYLGLLGMAYDYSLEMMKTGKDFLDKAEKRGVKVEKELNERVTEMRKEATEEVRNLRKRVETQVEEVKDEVTARGEAMEKEVQKAIEKVKPSSINGKNVQVDVVKIEVEVVTAPPVAGYDEMNVEEVREQLGLLDVVKLQEVRGYEVAHKNRITVLREIDAELEARAQAAVAVA